MEAVNYNDHELIGHQRWQILGGFGIVIQGLLGILSFLALVVKRYFEHPKRPVIVWLLDTSKQAFSCILAHWMNMVLAVLLSSANESDNWEWYFINITVDVFLGVFLWYLMLKAIEKAAMKYEITMLNTGNYVNMDYDAEVAWDFEPTKQTDIDDIDFRIWIAQIAVWGLIVIIVKLVLYCFQLLFAPVLESISAILIGWLKMYPNIKLVLIMVIWPFILNAVQFWIQDNILKSKKSRNKEFSQFISLKPRNSMYTGSEMVQMGRFDATKRSKTMVNRPKNFMDV